MEKFCMLSSYAVIEFVVVNRIGGALWYNDKHDSTLRCAYILILLVTLLALHSPVPTFLYP